MVVENYAKWDLHDCTRAALANPFISWVPAGCGRGSRDPAPTQPPDSWKFLIFIIESRNNFVITPHPPENQMFTLTHSENLSGGAHDSFTWRIIKCYSIRFAVTFFFIFFQNNFSVTASRCSQRTDTRLKIPVVVADKVNPDNILQGAWLTLPKGRSWQYRRKYGHTHFKF